MNLTADTIKPVEGMYAYVPNKPHLHNVVAGDVLVAGQVVKQDTTQTDTLCAHVKAAAATDTPFGVVVYDCRKVSNAVGDKVAIAQTGDVIYMVAGGAVTAGAKLQFTAATRKVDDTTTANKAFIGRAITPATADGDLIQVELDFTLGVQAAG